MTRDKFKQADFVRCFREHGLTYSQGYRAYTAMIEALESAMVNQQIVRLAHLGSLYPREVPQRDYKMGCRRNKGGSRDPSVYTYSVGRRIRFVFKMNETFGKRYGFR